MATLKVVGHALARRITVNATIQQKRFGRPNAWKYKAYHTVKVIQVVTLVSDNGAFGGPLTVALNQVKELRRRGHEVTIAAGWAGAGDAPESVNGVRIHAFRCRQVVPRTGFSGLFSRSLFQWLKCNVPAADLIHVHAGRDMVSLSALYVAHKAGIPAVAQTHGMIGPDKRFRAQVIDLVFTRRLMARCRTVLSLTDEEDKRLASAIPDEALRLVRLTNGVPTGQTLEASQGSLRAMADSSSGPRDVLYCARLQLRKRPVAFVEMANILREDGLKFSIVGPDEGQLEAVKCRINELDLGTEVRYEGALAYDGVLNRMKAATVYVLPSFDEPFPMSLLEAMSIGVPCVCTDSCGISGQLRESEAAIVTNGSPEEMAAAVRRLVNDSDLRERVSSRARDTVDRQFSISAVADDLERIYTGVVANVGRDD